MQFIERFFGTKRRRQERLIAETGISGQLRKEFIGPKFKEASTVEVNNDQFLEILRSGKHKKVLSRIANRSDTHVLRQLYINIGEDVLIKTDAVSIDYSNQRDLLSELHEMSFRYDPDKSKGDWGVFRTEIVDKT